MIGENMKNFILMLLFLMVAQPVLAQDQVTPAEFQEANSRASYARFSAIESDSLRISLDGSLNGFVEGKICDSCKKIQVKITPETKAYANNVEVPLKSAKARVGRYATVIFETKTKQVTAIRW